MSGEKWIVERSVDLTLLIITMGSYFFDEFSGSSSH